MGVGTVTSADAGIIEGADALTATLGAAILFFVAGLAPRGPPRLLLLLTVGLVAFALLMLPTEMERSRRSRGLLLLLVAVGAVTEELIGTALLVPAEGPGRFLGVCPCGVPGVAAVALPRETLAPEPARLEEEIVPTRLGVRGAIVGTPALAPSAVDSAPSRLADSSCSPSFLLSFFRR